MNSSAIGQALATALIAALGAAPSLWAQGTPPNTGSTSSVTYYATYELNGGAATLSNQTYTASATDTSAVWVANSGVLNLVNPAIATSGNTSSTDNSSFYGLNAALLASAGGSATVTGGTISTTGESANGAFATGTGSSVSLTNTVIDCTDDGAHGVMASQGGSLTLNNVTITTAGGSAAGLATDQGGGTVSASGGTVTVAGGNSPGIYPEPRSQISRATATRSLTIPLSRPTPTWAARLTPWLAEALLRRPAAVRRPVPRRPSPRAAS
jgi:hypothetical protein